MTLGFFIIGMLMMIAGFFMVRKTDFFLQNLGDISELFGVLNARWLSWKVFGVVLLFLGFMFAFGLFQTFFDITVGGLFRTGGR